MSLLTLQRPYYEQYTYVWYTQTYTIFGFGNSTTRLSIFEFGFDVFEGSGRLQIESETQVIAVSHADIPTVRNYLNFNQHF